ncbi:MAG: cell division protein FtsK [Proteobacteria bacterium]|nr:cell division protein FtsK [Pseudomonadota bacterium]
MKSAGFSQFIKSRFKEVLGACLIAFSVFLTLSFLSYDHDDPSFNLVTDEKVMNLAGAAGAFLAGPTIQFFGLAVAILVIAPFAWGLKMLRKDEMKLWLRITMLAVCLPVVAGLFTVVDTVIIPPETWPSKSFGGYIGNFVYTKIASRVPLAIYTPTMLAIGITTAFFAMGLSVKLWFAMLLLTGAGLKKFLGFLFKPFTAGFTLLVKKAFPDEMGVIKTLDVKQAPVGSTALKVEKPKKSLEVKRKAPKVAKEEKQTSLDLKQPNSFDLPNLNFLKSPPNKAKKENVSDSSLFQNATILEKVLDDFGITGKIVRVRPGPVVTLYELEPAPGIKSSRVIGLADDIARSMSAVSARIATIPGQNVIGIELPNATRQTVYMRELLETEEYKTNASSLPLTLGKDIGGEPVIADLAKMPHLLVAGTTGSGKSVAINTMILSLLYRYTPNECRFIMIDPKMLELSVYDGIPHLLTPVVTEPKKAIVALKWTVKEMENRYRLMSTMGVRNIANYNQRILEAKTRGETVYRTVQTGFDPDTGSPIMERVPLDMTPLPFIVVIVDEMADLMIVAGKDIEGSIQRLAQMARAAGIHIIMATQRPSVDVITGVIKANFPTRISFQVTSRIDSRTILGDQGAEQLLGQGDMLYMSGGSKIQRVHGPFVDDQEVEKVVVYLKKQGMPSYVQEVTQEDEEGAFGAEGGSSGPADELYDQAVAIVLRDRKASTSYIQRMLKIGYNRAASIMDRMEKEGVVSAANHVGKRDVLVENAG